MTKRSVNPYWLHVLLSPWAGLADDNESVMEYQSLDPNDEYAVRQVIRKLVTPYVARIDPISVGKIKDTYRYYLSKDDSSWERVFNSLLLPFDHPMQARDFFVWLWQECFPTEEWHIADLSSYGVMVDIEEPWRTMKIVPESPRS